MLMDNATKQRLYTPDFAQRMAGIDAVQWMVDAQQACDSTDPLDRLLFADNTTYLPDDLLVKVDIAAMQHSLEPCSPFLDHELAGLPCGALPAHYKLRGRTNKYILKKALEKHLPANILYREQKTGLCRAD